VVGRSEVRGGENRGRRPFLASTDGGVSGENRGWMEVGRRVPAGARRRCGGWEKRGWRQRLALGCDGEISVTVRIWAPADEARDGTATNLPPGL
jgi:hypothetical protein